MHAGRDVLRSIPSLRRLVALQQHVASRDQLARYGVDNHAVARQVRAGRWSVVGPLVVVMHQGPLLVEARRWVAVLNAGPLAALCSWTALTQWGLAGWDREPIHVVVPRGATPDALPWVRVHESRRHKDDDIVRVDGMTPTHSVARAAIDAAAWSSSTRTACGLLAATVQQRLTTVPELLNALEAAGRIRHRRLLQATLNDISGGADALSEIDLGRLCLAAGLPEPRRQSVRTDLRGRRRFRDAEWVRRDGRRVVCEIDGMGHLEIGRWYDDLMRDAELTRTEVDDIRLRLPATAVRTEPQRVIAILRSVLIA